MTQKKLLILVIVLVVTGGIVLLFENVNFGKQSDEGKAFFNKLSADNCSRIQINKSGKSLTLSLKADGWVVSETNQNSADKPAGLDNISGGGDPEHTPEYKADSSNVYKAIEKISNMKRDVLVSSNPEKKELFEVDTSKGLEIKIWDISGNSFGSFYVGKKGANTGSHYIRMLGSDKVYSVSGGVRYALHNKLDNWRDKHVNEFNPLNVESFTIAKAGKDPLVLEKKTGGSGDAGWVLITDGKEQDADNEETDKLVKNAAELKCTGWEEEKQISDPETGFDDPALVLNFRLDNGQDKKIVFGNATDENEKNYWVKNDKDNYIFIVSKYNMNKFQKKPEDIIKEKTDSMDNAELNLKQ